ncbi:MAG: hypothetical protein K9G67_12590 [Bacteroidales bacterium]|nr:hypothetical protein [Bacteroidales bacterium]MCF8352290.1 hypothetical protein [Bacteroidales bacterium]MCF8377188.1 hypothetical protein [Bacteroidales bacterium]MCF8401059.1 hypothetical protein [Bacteroidales bacterium]
MVKQFKSSYRKTDGVAEYPGIKVIKQRNRMRHNSIRLIIESNHLKVSPFLALINQKIKKPGNRIGSKRKSQDFSMRYIRKFILGRFEEIKENAITQMIKIFESDPEPELIYTKNSSERKYKPGSEILDNELRRTVNDGQDDFISGIMGFLIKIVNKIQVSFALDYLLNVDPHLMNSNEKHNIPPKIIQFTPAAINAMKIGFSKAFKSMNASCEAKIRESRIKFARSFISAFWDKLKSFSPINTNTTTHRHQLE